MDNEESFALLHEKLKCAASVAAFRSNPIGNFRCHLKACLLEVVAASCEKSLDSDQRYGKFDSRRLEKGLNVFPWKEICQCHDLQSYPRTSTQHDDSRTMLQEVVGHLLDPCVVPRACAAHLVTVLLEALLESPRRTSIGANRNESLSATRWSYSQLFLLQSIASLWQSCPHLKLSFMAAMEAFLTSTRHFIPHKWNRLLSIVSHLAIDCPPSYSTMLSFILRILENVDQLDTEHKVGDSPGITECFSCQNKSTNAGVALTQRRPRGVRLATIEDLHDKDISSTNYRPQFIAQRAIPRGVSLKDILSAKGRLRNKESQCRCHRGIISQGKVSLATDEWKVVRARCYKKFHVLFHQPPTWMNPGALHSRIPTPSSKFDLHHLLQVVHDNYQSSCLRLCLLLVVHNAASPIQCQRVCRMAWSRFARSKDPIWLQLYSENVATWSCFDDREQCWIVIQPLLDFVMEVIYSENEVDSVHCTGENASPRAVQSQSTVFRCLAHILSSRSSLFLQWRDELQVEFQSFITSLEIHCGEIGIWFNAKEQRSLDENNRELRTLQRLGILGLTSLVYNEDIECLVDDEDIFERSVSDDNASESLDEWPFSEPFDIRSAYSRAGQETSTKFSNWNTLLTSSDFDESISTRMNGWHLYEEGVRQSSVPLTEYIDNPDLLLQIFHHLSYQDIYKCRKICKGWHAVIDSSRCLWRAVYKSNFPIHHADQRAQGPIEQEDWKMLFSQKVSVERSLLCRRNQRSGYKHRTCFYIGCYHILKSERSEISHFASHARQSASKVTLPRKERMSQSISQKRLETPNIENSIQSRKRARSVKR